MWSAGTLPKMVIATPDADRSFYMDRKDGSQKWETAILFALVDHLREQYKVSRDRSGLFLYGISMGGMGALRMGFKHPERVGAVVALEPGIDPALKWADVKPRNRFWRSDELMETMFGKPLDEAYWEANNPANMAITNADKIRSSSLGIYVDAGDEDMFHLHEAAEFLHRILYDHQHSARIPLGPRRRSSGVQFAAAHRGRTRVPESCDESVEAHNTGHDDAQTAGAAGKKLQKQILTDRPRLPNTKQVSNHIFHASAWRLQLE